MLLHLKVPDQNLCVFLSFSSIRLNVFSLSYYRLLHLYILLVQQDQFLAFVCQLPLLQYYFLLIRSKSGTTNLKFQLECVLLDYLLCTVLWHQLLPLHESPSLLHVFLEILVSSHPCKRGVLLLHC